MHKHTYGDTVWEDNASYHWHQCTDAECPDVKASIKDKARHTFVGGKCDVCGRTRAYDDSSDDDDSDAGVSSDSGVSGTWHQDERGWRFRYTNGTYAKGSVATAADGTAELHVGWARVGGSWFAFDADGYMMQDWIYDAASGSWYYSDLTGMKKGWMQSPQDGRWYYLDPNSGAMHINTTTPDGSRVGADGAYIEQ